MSDVIKIDGERVTLANAERIARAHEPTLRLERYVAGLAVADGGAYYLTRKLGAQMWFSHGKTARHAWLGACDRIADMIERKSTR